MNISEAAEKSGLTAVTLRYYERIGLIPPVTRGNGGVRLYKESDLGWIDFIKCMRNAGLSIESLDRIHRFVRSGKGNRRCQEGNPDRRTEKNGRTLQRTRKNTGNTEQENRTLRAGPFLSTARTTKRSDFDLHTLQTTIIDKVNSPADVKTLNLVEMEQLAGEIRSSCIEQSQPGQRPRRTELWVSPN